MIRRWRIPIYFGFGGIVVTVEPWTWRGIRRRVRAASAHEVMVEHNTLLGQAMDARVRTAADCTGPLLDEWRPVRPKGAS